MSRPPRVGIVEPPTDYDEVRGLRLGSEGGRRVADGRTPGEVLVVIARNVVELPLGRLEARVDLLLGRQEQDADLIAVELARRLFLARLLLR